MRRLTLVEFYTYSIKDELVNCTRDMHLFRAMKLLQLFSPHIGIYNKNYYLIRDDKYKDHLPMLRKRCQDEGLFLGKLYRK